MIKLVVSDLDGTMFDKACIVPKEAAVLVRRLHENNILFTIASGRADNSVRAIAQALGVHCPYATSNGGTIMQAGRCLRRVEFPLRLLRAVCERTEQAGQSVLYTIDGGERVAAVTPLLEPGVRAGRHKLLPFTQEEWDTLSSEKVLIWDMEQSGLIDELDAMLSSIESLSRVRYGRHAMEITERTVSKAAGLRALSELLHIKLSEILMIGDEENDVEALKLAGVGAVVANANPAVKPVADYVCRGEHFAGIKEAVERFCFGEML